MGKHYDGVYPDRDYYDQNKNNMPAEKHDTKGSINQAYEQETPAEYPVHPKSVTGATREKLNMAPYDLVPIELVMAAAEGFNYGAGKYAPHNWRKGLPVVQVCCSLIRHVFAYMSGEDIDKASGQPHINLMACNVAMLATYTRSGPMLDDRRKWTPPVTDEKEEKDE